jgi:hypothetical protein
MTRDANARFVTAVGLATDLLSLSTPEVAKLKWLIEAYAQLRPEGQAAIDACLVALTPPRA